MGLGGLLVACGQEANGPADAALQKYVGKDISALTVKTLDGAPAPLSPLLAQGKPLVLNVWATWCAPCVEELPSLEKLGLDGDYTVVAISTDQDAAAVKAFLQKQKLGSGMTVLWDSLGSVTTPLLGSRALPASYVVNASGTITLAAAGERDWVHPKMRQKIKDSLQ